MWRCFGGNWSAQPQVVYRLLTCVMRAEQRQSGDVKRARRDDVPLQARHQMPGSVRL
jgi:hypothetical protein